MYDNTPRYVLITPARNEVARQQGGLRHPQRDSRLDRRRALRDAHAYDDRDGGREPQGRALADYDWIELIRRPERAERHFAGKVDAFNAGYARVKDLPYDIIGNLDGDVSFDTEYLAFLLSKFSENPRLGVAGTPFLEEEVTCDYSFSVEDVQGACQLFRRQCFEAIGGYRPMASGGIDLVAGLSARAKGWQTRTFSEKVCLHHRKSGSALRTGIREKLHRGRMDYLLGSHPLWEILRSIYQMKHKPYLVGGGLILWAYFWTMLRRVEKAIPGELVTLRRRDQVQRMKRLVGCSRRSL